jgi:nesprin-1
MSSVKKTSAEWYKAYQTEAFVHDNEFEECKLHCQSYDGKIGHIRDEQDRVQKKTFVNWINSHLAKKSPSLKIRDLIEDLKSGVVILILLEVLSGCNLQQERSRILQRPHFLSNCNTALEFLRTRKVLPLHHQVGSNVPKKIAHSQFCRKSPVCIVGNPPF